jgi:hypothetical protein
MDEDEPTSASLLPALPPPPLFSAHMIGDEDAMATLAQAALQREAQTAQRTSTTGNRLARSDQASAFSPSTGLSPLSGAGSSSAAQTSWIDVLEFNKDAGTSIATVEQNTGPAYLAYLAKLCNCSVAASQGQPVFNARLELSDTAKIRMLREANCFLFPPPALFDILVQHYVTIHFPFYPIFDLNVFLPASAQAYRGGLSIGIVWAVLAVAAAHVPNEALTDAGFPCRADAMRIFSQRARLFINSGMETDKLKLVQVKLLLATIWSGADLTRDSIVNEGHFWITSAISTAYSMQMHRNSTVVRLPKDTQRLWRRIFWCLYIRDKNSAAASDRPAILNEKYCDTPMPSPDDFVGDLERQHAHVLPQLSLLAVLRKSNC